VRRIFARILPNLPEQTRSPSLHKIVHLNYPGKKRIAGVGFPQIAITKIIEKHFLAHIMLFFNVQWDIFNKCRKL